MNLDPKPELEQSVLDEMEQSRCKFDERQATPLATNAYVLWLDLMGAVSAMSRSLPKAANFIMRIHDAVLRAAQAHSSVTLYPINDGVYAISEDQIGILQFLRRTMWLLADQFIIEPKQEHRCLVRGTISFGRVLRGNSLAAGLVGESTNSQYMDAIVIGMPIGQAFRAEHEAPPYGIVVHESARGFAPQGVAPMSYVFWKWFDYAIAEQAPKLKAFRWHLTDYLNWLEHHHRAQLYPLEALTRHRQMADEYFAF